MPQGFVPFSDGPSFIRTWAATLGVQQQPKWSFVKWRERRGMVTVQAICNSLLPGLSMHKQAPGESSRSKSGKWLIGSELLRSQGLPWRAGTSMCLPHSPIDNP